MRRAALMMALVVGCGEDAQPQSHPVATEPTARQRRINVPVRPDGPRPVGMAAISARWPAFNGSAASAQGTIAGVLNLVPAPCEVCENRTIAHCATAEPAIVCPVLDGLFERVFRMANKGGTVDAIKVAVNYPDFWIEGLGQGTPVQVHLYRDVDGRFQEDTKAVEQGLRKVFGDGISWATHEASEESAASLGVRSYPTWFINGHRFRGVQSVNSLARFVAYETEGVP